MTISDGCDGILYIGADSENTDTIDATVTGEEKGWLDGGKIRDMCRRGYKVREDSRAVSVEYLALYDKYSIGWMRKYKPPAGRKTRLRAWQLLMRSVKSAFALLLTKVTKHIPPQTSPVGLSLAGI